jgi:hypothetical protein
MEIRLEPVTRAEMERINRRQRLQMIGLLLWGLGFAAGLIAGHMIWAVAES